MNSGCLKIVCLRKLLFGEVKGICSPGSTSSFNDVALRDCQNWRISRPYRDAQDRLQRQDLSCAYPALESLRILVLCFWFRSLPCFEALLGE